MHKINLAISPCPNDTFMFYGLIHNKINHDLDIKVDFWDIKELNTHALSGKYDVSKISFNLLPQVAKAYWLLNSGSALGKGCGPLIISKSISQLNKDDDYHCLIPGINTTANFLLSTLYPNIKQKEITIFSDIEKRLSHQEADIGLVIHETRFTYKENGFHKLADLGEEWESTTNLPIPLGGIIAKRTLDQNLVADLQKAIEQSIRYAYDNESEAMEYCRDYAQDMRDEIMKSHIELYVNEYSLNLGEEGQKTINHMLKKMQENRQIDEIPSNVFF